MAQAKLTKGGSDAFVTHIKGDKLTQAEAATYLTKFPGGHVEISRCTNGDYWIHVHVNRSEFDGEGAGRIKDARLDLLGKHAGEANVGDFNSPNLYHLAVRVEKANSFVPHPSDEEIYSSVNEPF